MPRDLRREYQPPGRPPTEERIRLQAHASAGVPHEPTRAQTYLERVAYRLANPTQRQKRAQELLARAPRRLSPRPERVVAASYPKGAHPLLQRFRW